MTRDEHFQYVLAAFRKVLKDRTEKEVFRFVSLCMERLDEIHKEELLERTSAN